MWNSEKVILRTIPPLRYTILLPGAVLLAFALASEQGASFKLAAAVPLAGAVMLNWRRPFTIPAAAAMAALALASLWLAWGREPTAWLFPGSMTLAALAHLALLPAVIRMDRRSRPAGPPGQQDEQTMKNPCNGEKNTST
jgi:hypothetical protein